MVSLVSLVSMRESPVPDSTFAGRNGAAAPVLSAPGGSHSAMTSADDDRGPRVHLAAGLNQAQQAEARRVFAALNTTRAQRHEQAAASGSAQPLPLCATLLSNAKLCLRVLVDEQECPHREPGPAPTALQHLVADLRQEVADARRLARDLYAALPAGTRGAPDEDPPRGD